jgi:hypothetical protein
MSEHMRMFEQQQMIVGAMLEEGGLYGERLAVRHPSQPAHTERAGGGHSEFL